MDNKSLPSHKNRPLFITVLCIIAFIHIGSLIVVGLFGSLSQQSFMEVSGIMGVFMEGAGYISSQFSVLLSVIMLVLAVLAFLGIIQMWNMMRSGVWFFSVSMIIFLLLPLLILPSDLWFVLVPNFIFIPLLIILFSMNYKKFKPRMTAENIED
ncbi:MAG: hypothetical protein ACOCW7_02295 [Bacteroidota bacterium]